MVVDRAEVGLVAKVRGHLHFVDHAVEGDALVHERERLRFDRVEEVGGVDQRLAMRSRPTIGKPCPARRYSALSAAIPRKATAQSPA